MVTYDNPAGRLHALLTQFACHREKTIRQAWAHALDVPSDQVPLYLGRVASLIRETQKAAEETEDPAFEPIVDHLRTLANSIFPEQHAYNSQARQVAPNQGAMQALAMLSAFLHRTASEGAIPADNELEELVEGVRELIALVTESGLAPDVKRPLLHRLSELLEALEHLEVGGPDAARRAAEALAASTVIYGTGADDAATVSKVKSLAKRAWTIFAAGTVLATAPLGWDRLLHPDHLLNPGEAQRALPAGPQERSATPDAGAEPPGGVTQP